MAADTDDTGFLSRWSRRKALVRQGAVPLEPAAPVPAAPRQNLDAPPPPAVAVAQSPVATGAAPAQGVPAPAPASVAPVAEDRAAPPPAPTLADVATLTRESDYSRFVGRSVQPEVRNAALGKLFADPHFNVMDGLDVYIDDYGQPDPLPESMLRKMFQAQAMGLFADEEKTPPAAPASAAPTLPDPPALPIAAEAPPPDTATDENTDLQLQPDDDAGRAGAEPGAGEDAGRAH